MECYTPNIYIGTHTIFSLLSRASAAKPEYLSVIQLVVNVIVITIITRATLHPFIGARTQEKQEEHTTEKKYWTEKKKSFRWKKYKIFFPFCSAASNLFQTSRERNNMADDGTVCLEEKTVPYCYDSRVVKLSAKMKASCDTLVLFISVYFFVYKKQNIGHDITTEK